jgi:uncharacterized protein YbjT (DUF2867 family)
VYTLTGSEALSYSELAAEVSSVLGRPINHVSLPPSALKSGMLAAGTPEWLADLLLDLERYFAKDKASPITTDIKRVTGREPIRFEQYAREFAPQLKAARAVS